MIGDQRSVSFDRLIATTRRLRMVAGLNEQVALISEATSQSKAVLRDGWALIGQPTVTRDNVGERNCRLSDLSGLPLIDGQEMSCRCRSLENLRRCRLLPSEPIENCNGFET
jgi:hypothetical protein